jgi:DNA modification methylase
MTTPVIIGDATLYCGDCLAIYPQLGEFAIVLTDPPYGIAYQSGHATNDLWGSARTIANDRDTDARDWLLTLLPADMPVLCFGSERAFKPIGTRMTLVWDKGGALGMGALDIPWKPSSERIYVLGKGWVGARDEHDVLYCPPVQSMAHNGRLHPNEKPVPLLQRLLRKCPAGTVLDPFMGSGSTGVACVKEQRPFIGIEIDERYFDIACRRIEQAYAQPDMFVAPPAKPTQEAML